VNVTTGVVRWVLFRLHSEEHLVDSTIDPLHITQSSVLQLNY